jgi:hypothetical protein
LFWHQTDVPPQPSHVRYQGMSGLSSNATKGPSLTQAVWKRFSYPNNCKQPGVMDLDATG